MSKPKKHPKVKVEPHLQKKPRIDLQNSPEKVIKRSPVWRIGSLDFGGPWGWERMGDLSLFKAIREKLKNFETMTWSEIEGRDHHFISIKNISKEAKQRLQDINQDDLDQLFSLRLSAKERLWGIRKEEILNILWWDPEHSVYPVPKKHT